MAKSGIDHGYGAVVIRAYYKTNELTAKVEHLKYCYDEEGDDVATLTIKTDRREDPDEPWFQEKAELQLTWGYIEGETSECRKVYIQEIKWKLDEENLTATITATDKLVSLKFSDSNEVHRNTTMLGIAEKLARQNGLKAVVEIPNDPSGKDDFIADQEGGLETVDKYLKRNNALKAKRDFDKQNKLLKENPTAYYAELKDVLKSANLKPNKEDSVRKKYQDAYNDGAPINVELATRQEMARSNLLANFKDYKNVPQANRTGKQLLTELARREKNGPWIVEGRDDMLIIRKRNFNQKPYKTYTFGGPDGNLLDFCPMSKNRSRKHTSVNQSFSGWNAMDKTFFRGDANAESSTGDPMLAKFTEMVKFYKGLQKAGKGQLVAGWRRQQPKHIFISPTNVDAKSDNALVYTQGNINIPYTVDDKVSALEKALGAYNELAKQYNKNVYDALGINPQDAFYNANNNRGLAQLKNNPATATVYGDPNLKVGMLITIIGISKKYSGNYYITKCDHDISGKSGGYKTDLEMVRHGVNIKATEDHESNVALGLQFNNWFGPEVPGERKGKRIPIITNPED